LERLSEGETADESGLKTLSKAETQKRKETLTTSE
jgi:hypothetical protein